MEKIRVLFTINYLTNGGPTRVLQNIIYGMPKDKYDIFILTILDKNNTDIVEELKKLGVTIEEVNLKKGKIGIILNKNKIIKKIEKINPDIVHVHGIEMSYVVSSKKVNSIKLTTIHNSLYEDYKYAYGKLKGKLVELLHLMCLKKFHENICCSKTSYDYLSERVKNASYIRNGVIVKHNNAAIRKKIREELRISDNDIVFVYGGVINNRKRVLQLVKMFSKSSKENEKLIIVGDGPLLEECKNNSNKNVIYVGFKTNIIDYFDASDVYVSNSSAEGFSISLIEALSSGLICLVSNIPSHKECFEIDDKTYIGEYFNENEFNIKKDKILKRIKSIDKDKIKEFQEKYLSSNSMSSLYCEKYSGWIKK